MIYRLAKEGFLEKTARGTHRITKIGLEDLVAKGMLSPQEAQQAFDKMLANPEQLNQHLEHETRAASLSGGEGMEL